MDNDVLEYACGIGAWISLIFLISAHMIAEENQVQSDELTKAYISMVIPFCIMMIIYIFFQVFVVIAKLIWWILTLMVRSDILVIVISLILLNFLVITVKHTTVMINDTTNLSPGIKDEL